MSAERMFRSGTLAGVLIVCACSQETGQVAGDTVAVVTSAPEPAVVMDSRATQESVRIYVDPATGEIREPSEAEESAASRSATQSTTQSTESSAANKPSEPPHIREIHLPDGSMAIIPDTTGPEYVQACVRSDDSVLVGHACLPPPARQGAGK